jgi:hypothetical protein
LSSEEKSVSRLLDESNRIAALTNGHEPEVVEAVVEEAEN